MADPPCLQVRLQANGTPGSNPTFVPTRTQQSTRFPPGPGRLPCPRMNERSDLISVVFTKWGGRQHWHFECGWLGEDEFGAWLAGRPGTRLQRGDEPAIIELPGFVQLVPCRGEWIAFFNAAGPFEIYVDVTSTPVWTGGTVTCVDLDLDVVRRPDGKVQLLDEDEFIQHQIELKYPADTVRSARATAEWLLNAVAAGHGPFGGAGAAWLAAQPWAGASSDQTSIGE